PKVRMAPWRRFVGIKAMTSKSTSTRLAILSVSAFVVTAAMTQSARSEIWNIGGTASVNGTNAPNNFSQSVTLTLGTIPIDSGAINLTSSIVNVAGGAEWLILHFSTAIGGPIVGNTNNSWQLQALEPLAAPANGLGFYLDWSANGTLLTPTQSFGGVSPGTNP